MIEKETCISVWQTVAQIEPPSELTFDKGMKNTVEEKDVVFNNSCEATGHPHCREMNPGQRLRPSQKLTQNG